MTAQLYERLIVQRCLLGRLSTLADTSREAFLDQQRSYRGTCVEAVPLDAGFNGPVLGSERPALVR